MHGVGVLYTGDGLHARKIPKFTGMEGGTDL